VYSDNSLTALALDADGAVHQLSQQPRGGPWDPAWSECGGSFAALTVLRSRDGTLHAFGLDHNNTIIHAYEADGDEDRVDWYEFGGQARRLALLSAASGYLHVFAIGVDGALWQCERPHAGEWTDWRDLGGDHQDLVPLEVDGLIHVYTVGTDGAVWELIETDAGIGDWTRLGGADITHVFAARTTGAQVRLFALDRAGQLFTHP
jgi:hypothetical protein